MGYLQWYQAGAKGFCGFKIHTFPYFITDLKTPERGIHKSLISVTGLGSFLLHEQQRNSKLLWTIY